MKIDELKEKLKDSVIRCSPKKEDIELNDDFNLGENLGYSSMNFIQLIVDLENIFDIEIPDEHLNDKMYNYGYLCGVVSSLVGIM